MSRGPRGTAAIAEPASEVAKAALKSDSDLAASFRTAALCRTKNGWAIAMVEIDVDGKLTSLELGPSQSFPDHVVGRLVKQQMALNQETLKKSPWRPGGG